MCQLHFHTQNDIIRDALYKDIVVQGVAGSGKTTIALHRIAYLIYNYDKNFFPEEFLIIAPNKFFLNYISNVLPDLGVDRVGQSTYEEIAFAVRTSACMPGLMKPINLGL